MKKGIMSLLFGMALVGITPLYGQQKVPVTKKAYLSTIAKKDMRKVEQRTVEKPRVLPRKGATVPVNGRLKKTKYRAVDRLSRP